MGDFTGNFIRELLRMSLAGGILIAAVALVRALCRDRVPMHVFPALWALALVRLLVPFSFELPATAAERVERDIPALAGVNRGLAAILPAPSAPEAATRPQAARFPIVPAVWAAVGIALALWLLISWLRLRREFAASTPVENDFAELWLMRHPTRRRLRIRQLPGLPSPLTYGILRPVILVPADMDWSDERTARYILYHEYTHIRRFDALRKLAASLALCLHWFNPLMWLLFALQDRDIELACDERVLSHYGRTSRRDYAMTIISLERNKPQPFAGFAGDPVERRIRSIMKFNKRSVFALVIVIVFAAAATVTAFAAAPGDSDAPNPGGQDIVNTPPDSPNDAPAGQTPANNAPDAHSDNTPAAVPGDGDQVIETYSWPTEEDMLKALDELDTYPLDKLMAYAAIADGAYAESVEYEITQRFCADPSAVLDAVSRQTGTFHDFLSLGIGVELKWDGKGDAIDRAESMDLTAAQRAALEEIRAAYQRDDI